MYEFMSPLGGMLQTSKGCRSGYPQKNSIAFGLPKGRAFFMIMIQFPTSYPEWCLPLETPPLTRIYNVLFQLGDPDCCGETADNPRSSFLQLSDLFAI